MIIISAIGLLSSFLSLGTAKENDFEYIYIQIGIHLVLSVSAVLLAFSDRLDKA